MKKSVNYALVFSLAILFAIYPFQSASAQAGGYIGIWGGYTISPYAGSGDYNDDDHYNHWDYNNYDLNIDETYVLGVKVGFVHPQLKFLAFEFEYSYLNPDIKRTTLYGYESDFSVEGDIKLHNFMFNVIAKYPIGIVHPYVGAGIGLSYSDMSAKAAEIGDSTSAVSIGDNYSAFAWQLLTGVEIDLAKNLALDIGYHYFATQLKFNDNMEYSYGYSRDIDFDTSIITMGLKFLF